MSWGLKDEYTWSSELNFNTQMEVPVQFIIKKKCDLLKYDCKHTCTDLLGILERSVSCRERTYGMTTTFFRSGRPGRWWGGVYEDPWNTYLLTRQNDGEIVGWSVCFIPLTTFWSFSIWSCCLPLYTTAATEKINLGWIWENLSRTPLRRRETHER